MSPILIRGKLGRELDGQMRPDVKQSLGLHPVGWRSKHPLLGFQSYDTTKSCR